MFDYIVDIHMKIYRITCAVLKEIEWKKEN